MPLTTAFWLLIAIPWQGQGTPRNKNEIDLLHTVPGNSFQSNMLCQITMPQSSQLICAILDENEDHSLSFLFEKHFFPGKKNIGRVSPWLKFQSSVFPWTQCQEAIKRWWVGEKGVRGEVGYNRLNLWSTCTYQGNHQFLEKSHVISGLTRLSKCAYSHWQTNVFEMHCKMIYWHISCHHFSLYQHSDRLISSSTQDYYQLFCHYRVP